MIQSENFESGNMFFQNGILSIEYNAGTLINEAVLINQITVRQELVKEPLFYLLIDLRNATDVTQEAMLLAAENPSPAGIKGIALITKAGMDFTRAKLYSVFDRPNIVTKAFLNTDDAKSWFDLLDQKDLRKAS